MSKYYYHGLGEAFYHCNSLERALSILKTGGIKCKRLLNLPEIYECTCNGMDYVSICKKLSLEEYQESFMYEHAFPEYVQNCFCFILSDEIDAITPERIPMNFWSSQELEEQSLKHPNKRFTDMCDEWQVKEIVPLSAIIGVGIPLQWIDYHWDDASLLETLSELISLAEALGLDIVDTNSANFVEEYEASKIAKEKEEKEKEYS